MFLSMAQTLGFVNQLRLTESGLATSSKDPASDMSWGYQLVVVTLFGRRGGFPCGEWPDIKIAKDLYLHYAANEITLADKGYRHVPQFKQPTNAFEKRVLARHETLNHRIKQFKALGERWRHNLRKHPKVFHAVVNIVQISINNGENMFTM